MDASEIHAKRLNAKEVIFPKQGEFIFPIADGRIKPLGGDQDLRTSTSIQGESRLDFLPTADGTVKLSGGDQIEEKNQGESDGSSSTPLRDSSCHDGEARNDFWSISGNFIVRHHVEPRVKLYVPREASCPIPLKLST